MIRQRRCALAVAFLTVLILLGTVLASYAEVLDAPRHVLGSTGTNKQAIRVVAGASGAPGGFTIWWMKEQDFIDNGSEWCPPGDPRQGEAHFWGVPTLNVFVGDYPTFRLAPWTRAKIEIGDLADETGVDATTTDELELATTYVCCVFANAYEGFEQSQRSEIIGYTTLAGANCIRSQGYWKNHEEDWPVFSLVLGNVGYDQAQLLSILNEPVHGNGLISLAHQLIAAKLNIANGGDAEAAIRTIVVADDMIGDLVVPPVGDGFLRPRDTGGLTQVLDDWNNQVIGSGICETEFCCLVPDGVCFPTEIGRCDEIGGFVIPPDGCDTYYQCEVPAQPEACCYEDGTCVMLLPDECGDGGGTPMGEATDCDPNPCPQPPSEGACCYGCAECMVTTEEGCMNLTGWYLWLQGEGCDPNPCPPTKTEIIFWGSIKSRFR